MRNQLEFDNSSTITTDEMLKKTSLSYLQEALMRQKYEDCAELIETAKGFGASQAEVSFAISKLLNKVQLYEAQRNGFKYS